MGLSGVGPDKLLKDALSLSGVGPDIARLNYILKISIKDFRPTLPEFRTTLLSTLFPMSSIPNITKMFETRGSNKLIDRIPGIKDSPVRPVKRDYRIDADVESKKIAHGIHSIVLFEFLPIARIGTLSKFIRKTERF